MCDNCGKRYISRHCILSHVVTHFRFKDFECSECEKFFPTTARLKVHVKQVHSDNDQSLKCNICEKVFKYNRQLKSHQLIHVTAKKYKCRDCEEAFKIHRELRQHMETNHSSDEFKCRFPGCSKIFFARSNLRQHLLKVHCNKEKFKCQFCDRLLKTKKQLQFHESLHQKVFKCDSCDSEFKSSVEFQKHKNLHAPFSIPEKAFNCDTCQKEFKTARQLKIHQTDVHDDRFKKHVCKFCGARFKRSFELTLHLISHADQD